MSAQVDLRERLARYAAFFADLGPGGLDRLGEQFAPGARFKDPFNDVRGIEQIREVFRHMYATLDGPRFLIHGFALSGRTGYIHWTLDFVPRGRLRRLRPIDGLSRVRFDEAGRVAEHVDYWDAAEQVYQRLPLVGALLRLMRSRFSAARR
ncbi:MAG: nuclear transport factor 2 family protein [Chromatiales bacterium]|jgi:steroid delta-isomerase